MVGVCFFVVGGWWCVSRVVRGLWWVWVVLGWVVKVFCGGVWVRVGAVFGVVGCGVGPVVRVGWFACW